MGRMRAFSCACTLFWFDCAVVGTGSQSCAGSRSRTARSRGWAAASAPSWKQCARRTVVRSRRGGCVTDVSCTRYGTVFEVVATPDPINIAYAAHARSVSACRSPASLALHHSTRSLAPPPPTRPHPAVLNRTAQVLERRARASPRPRVHGSAAWSPDAALHALRRGRGGRRLNIPRRAAGRGGAPASAVFAGNDDPAQRLREVDPESFAVLTRVPGTFQKVHYKRDRPVSARARSRGSRHRVPCARTQVDLVRSRTHIQLSRRGEVAAIFWAPAFEGPLRVPAADVEPYFRAYTAFGRVIEELSRTK